MTPYYEGRNVVLYHGDCREVLPSLGLRADAIVTDPPYGDTALAWDRRAALDWLPLATDWLAPHGSVWCFASLRYLLRLQRAGALDRWRIAEDVVWEKHNGSGFATDRFKRVHEHAIRLWPAGVPWGDVYTAIPRIAGAPRPSATIHSRGKTEHTNGIGSAVRYEYTDTRIARSVIYARNENGRAVHPTQKPVAIVRPLVESACAPGGVVLDAFAGSGTIGVVARLTGRHAVLVEQEEAHCEAAARRLDDDQLSLMEVTHG
jgi:site-specific DNA-methyltransferase (adenine-specific)